MAAAYAQAASGHPFSQELILMDRLERFGGAMNVLGRVLGASEMRRITVAQNIVAWFQQREQAGNVAEWTASNRTAADLLDLAYKSAVKLGLLEG